jgi:hypothetical protein
MYIFKWFRYFKDPRLGRWVFGFSLIGFVPRLDPYTAPLLSGSLLIGHRLVACLRHLPGPSLGRDIRPLRIATTFYT